MKFSPGDPVWARSYGDNCPSGEYAGIIVEPMPTYILGYSYRVDIPAVPSPGPSSCWIINEKDLRPRTDGQDKEPLGSWSECPWQPAKETV